MTDVRPSVGNPIIVQRIGNKIEVRMLPAAGWQQGDYQRHNLTQSGPYIAGSMAWGLDGHGGVLGSTAADFLTITAGKETTLESAVYVSPNASTWATDGDYVGINHGHIKRTQCIAFVNGDAPEFFGSLTEGWVPCKGFYIDQTFDCYLKDNLTKWGTWRVMHNFGLFGGRWALRVEQYWTPTAPVYLRTLYGLMAAATGINCVTRAPLSDIVPTLNDDSVTPDFGQTISQYTFYNTSRPNARLKVTLALGNAGTNASLSNGFAHLQDQKDGVDKVRSMHTSKETPVLWTQEVRLLTDYEIGVY